MSANEIKNALISVTDKSGLSEFASILRKRGIHILASSGTKIHLESKGIVAEEISSYTNSRELLDGRVKTLHPKIHAGILADRKNPAHMKSLKEKGIRSIDLVIVNLYPFREKYSGSGLSEQEMCEFIDIGGIALIRAAAKNYSSVTVITNPEQYAGVAREIEEKGGTTIETRRILAGEAFKLSSAYDSCIREFFDSMTEEDGLPTILPMNFERAHVLRYGENPHQKGAIYSSHKNSYLLSSTQIQGKELSFNNYIDIIGAFALARDLGKNRTAIIKHTNPCGAGWCGDIRTSYERALACDSQSAFGGIVAANGEIDGDTADAMIKLFLEVVLARSFTVEALARFSRKKNLRVISIPDKYWDLPQSVYMGLFIEDAFLYQELDTGFPEIDSLETVTKKHPNDVERKALINAWKTAKHVKSNSIVIANESGTVGIGAGQMSRVDAARIAVEKAGRAGLSLKDSVAASDAFFPFADGVIELAESGITSVIQPGGSIRDNEVIASADSAGISMVFTGRRHFRHL